MYIHISYIYIPYKCHLKPLLRCCLGDHLRLLLFRLRRVGHRGAAARRALAATAARAGGEGAAVAQGRGVQGRLGKQTATALAQYMVYIYIYMVSIWLIYIYIVFGESVDNLCIWLVVELSEKYELVNWDHGIPNRWKNKMNPTNKMNAHTYVTDTDVQTHFAKQRFPFQYKV